MTHPTYRLRSFPSLQVALSLACATITVCTLSAQAPAPLGEPRWMPVDRIQGGRTADALALEKSLLAIIDREGHGAVEPAADRLPEGDAHVHRG